MIHFIVATLSEGRPLIDFFNLKISNNNNIFKIYHSTDISLTISGIGKLNSAMSVIKTFFDFNKQKNNIWINLGLAGHKNYNIGDLFLVNKIEDSSSNKIYYPFVAHSKLKSIQCITYEKENLDYNESLSEMEASGFFYSANKFTSVELVQVLKIISDNDKESINFNDKHVIYDLIFSNKKKIINLCGSLHKIKENIKDHNLQYIHEEFDEIFKGIKFSFTEKQQMKSLLKLYFARYNFLKKDLFNYKKNGASNIRILKNFLRV